MIMKTNSFCRTILHTRLPIFKGYMENIYMETSSLKKKNNNNNTGLVFENFFEKVLRKIHNENIAFDDSELIV